MPDEGVEQLRLVLSAYLGLFKLHGGSLASASRANAPQLRTHCNHDRAKTSSVQARKVGRIPGTA